MIGGDRAIPPEQANKMQAQDNQGVAFSEVWAEDVINKYVFQYT